MVCVDDGFLFKIKRILINDVLLSNAKKVIPKFVVVSEFYKNQTTFLLLSFSSNTCRAPNKLLNSHKSTGQKLSI